jgi:hypothetical protein
MACGDRYRHLIVTVSGLSPENPYDHVPTSSDYEEWQDLARRLSNIAQRFRDALSSAEQPVDATMPRWWAIVPAWDSLVQHYDELPSEWLAVNLAQAVGEAESVCFEATCIMERCEDALAELGGKPPDVPGTPDKREKPTIANTVPVGGIAIAAGIIIAAALILRK